MALFSIKLYQATIIFFGVSGYTVAENATGAPLEFVPVVVVQVVHGNPVLRQDKWSWQVFIELNSGDSQCGGSLISDRWILTAAHCFERGLKPTKIVLGSKRKTGKTFGAVIIEAERICCHKDYNPRTQKNDICMIKLISSAPFGPTISSIPLPEAEAEITDGTLCDVTGWGYDEDGNLPDILQEATVKIVDRKRCIDWHSSQGILVVNNTICAGHEMGGADTCGGDSGGSLVCSNSSGKYILHGITSYGPSFCGASKAPGVYTKVSKFMNWIKENIANPCSRTYSWSAWSETCSVTCATGTRTRTRTCKDMLNHTAHNYEKCGSENTVEYGTCHLSACPVSRFNWSNWSQWSLCQSSNRCSGQRFSTRQCVFDRLSAWFGFCGSFTGYRKAENCILPGCGEPSS